MKKKILILPLICICFSFVASSCEDLTLPPENPPPPIGDDYYAIKLYTEDAGGTWEVHEISIYVYGYEYLQYSCHRIASLSSDLSNIRIITSDIEVDTLVNYISKSSNFGNNWVASYYESPRKFSDLAGTGTIGKGFIVGLGFGSERSLIKMTTNDGLNWSDLPQFPTNEIPLLEIEFAYEMTGIIIPVNPGDNTLHTIDGGANWSIGNSIPTGNYINAVKFVNSHSPAAVVCGNSGTILKTSDAGATWTEITSPTTENLTSIYFSEPIGIIVGENGTILRSEDGGNSWQIVSSGTSGNLKKVYQDPGSLWWAVGDNIILQSGSGQLWGTVRNSSTEYYNDIYIIKGAGFVVGSRRR